MYVTTATGHVAELAVLAAFLFCLAVPTYFEARKRNKAKANAVRPTGATKI